MSDLIVVRYDTNRPTVLGRDLYRALEIGTHYKDWFPRMCAYGFAEGRDFNVLKNERVQTEGSRRITRTITDHQLTLDMAKEICMIQRSEKGRICRQYFLDIERQWNSPEAVMARALQFAQQQMAALRQRNDELSGTLAIQKQQITELQPKASYYDVILNCKDLISTSTIAKDYGKSAIWMNRYLHSKGIQFKRGDIWLLYQRYAECGYTSTKTYDYSGSDGEPHSRVHTYWTQKGRLFIYELLKADGILPQIERGEG